ncbi:hypothetical protein LguiA_035458 [Lonicera macranthoides]
MRLANKLGKSSAGSIHKRENRQNAFNKLINMNLIMNSRNLTTHREYKSKPNHEAFGMATAKSQ